ncbi:MAG: helix-turn-helix domain-containing protein, partial [Ruminococcaceae bacterium]|nr:helix-turn-helix domain-containing protein [Oscillospiraceae bacterium]
MSLKEKNIKHETAIEKIIDVMGLTRVLVERMYGKYIYHAAFVSTGRKLRKLREGRGLSVESLAERIG